VSLFDSRDAFSYVNASATDATPVNGLTGDGIWNRDGYHNEGVTFDPALAHQAGNNYHYHAHPIGLRYQLGDHVDYNAATNRYTESAAAVTGHSPILAWAADGLPVYGPYGYCQRAGRGQRCAAHGVRLSLCVMAAAAPPPSPCGKFCPHGPPVCRAAPPRWRQINTVRR
jgi:hypothetical protein